MCGVLHQAYVVFDECDTDKSGTIGRAEGEVMLDKLIDLDNGSQRGAVSGKGSKPLFCTAASVPPVMRHHSTVGRNGELQICIYIHIYMYIYVYIYMYIYIYVYVRM